METRYRTVKGYGETEIVIQKSRFITRVNRVSTEQEAAAFVEEISKKHWDATHNCYAYVTRGTQVQKSSDDGEPAGTAGRPILEVIRNRDLHDTVIVVTRYFGGIKLGASGLIRAYSQCAAAGIDTAGEVERILHRKMSITTDYSFVGKMEHELRTHGFDMDPPEFTDQVTWHLWVPLGEEAEVTKWVTELTNGRASVTEGETMFREKEVKP
jgi:uncharacterized YigZ family protein